MATIHCSLCRETAVRKAGEKCSQCRYMLRHPEAFPGNKLVNPPAAPAAPDPASVDAADLLARAKGMAADQIRRLEDALAGNGLFQGDTLNEMTKLVRVLETVVGLELSLRKAAKGKVQTQDERIESVAIWAREQLPKAKRERLVQLLTEGA